MAEGRIYRPGSRRPGTRPRRNDGLMSEDRYAWLRTAVGQMVIMAYNNDEDDRENTTGPTIRLYLPRPGGRPFSLNITALTKPELDAMRGFFTLLFDTAEPFVLHRDRMAQDALAAGDDSFARVYREVPQFVVRERAKPRHVESLHNGPEGLHPGDRGAGDSSNESGGVRSELADGESSEGSPEDDWSETDEPEGVREVGGPGPDTE